MAAVLAAVLLTVAGVVEGQRRGRFVEEEPNVAYDGRFTFARIRYDLGMENFGRGEPPWRHDYPRGERNFTKILSELSTVSTRTTESNILALTDPEIFKYPVLYMAEPGYWRPDDLEVANLRKYLLKGGFLFLDDFPGQHFYNVEVQLRRVLPEARIVELTTEHPIFDSFYRIESLDYAHPYYGGRSVFHGVFEDNDPTKRLMMIINTNNDLSEYWEFSDQGMFPIEASNEAYKLGINYIVYALTR
jgi:hypothetical protein